MNILPKKRWHVRTKQNIERVRRDEAKAAEEEKELKRRIELAEQEARTDLLRKKARLSVPSSEEPSHSNNDHTLEHVNFFKEIEETGKYVGGINKEHQAEEKAEKEKFERNIGLLTYLGESSLEATGNKPWYLQATNRKSKHVETKSDEETASKKYKDMMDPLNVMNSYLLCKNKKNKESVPLYAKNIKHNQESKTCKSSRSKSHKTIEQLRAERLEREKKEQERSRQLLKKLTNGEEKEPEVIYDDRRRKYNSQFNPHLAKQSLSFLKPKQFVKGSNL